MDYRKPSKHKSNELFLESIRSLAQPVQVLEETIEQNKLFLIVCEGENTEPGYFKGFPVPSKMVMIEGGRNSKTALVDYAISIKDTEKFAGREVWCVFDYDIKPDEAATQPADFNNAITKAAAHNMKVAWSNDAFELWFVLHYQRMDAVLTRNELFPVLKGHWELDSFSGEAKKKEFCDGHYKRHGGDESEAQGLAIRRAKELHKIYNGRADYANHCPCTTVYLLVEELNKFLKR